MCRGMEFQSMTVLGINEYFRQFLIVAIWINWLCLDELGPGAESFALVWQGDPIGLDVKWRPCSLSFSPPMIPTPALFSFLWRCSHVYTGCPRMFYTQKCKIFRIFITIKTIEFGILIYLSDWAVLLAFWRILNQGNWPNKTENTWHYVKRVIFCILIELGKEGFMCYSA